MANEQTSVPLFVADTILTAAQQNISAGTGVPVFATTVTRDAAFGGANKALAEGQLCYLSSTNVVQQYNGSGWETVGPSTSKVVQVVNTQTGAVATGTALIPPDNTIPQITEGTEFMTLAITPTSASNILYISAVANVSNSTTNYMTMALFQDATANALAAGMVYQSTAAAMVQNEILHKMTAGTTSATTFRIRIGAESAGTNTFNGGGGARLMGGVMASSITITEVTS